MKKRNDQSVFVFIIIVLFISLVINLAGITMYIRNIHSYKYSSYKTSFDMDTTSSNAIVYATLKESDQGFSEGLGPREITLSYGKNVVPIEIQSKNKTKKNYTLFINRIDNRSSENRLSDLVVNNQKIDLKNDQNSYVVKVGKNIDKVNINASLKSSKSYFADGYGPRQIDLSEGLNVAFINVKSESGIERQYKINIFKNNNEDSDLYLESDELESLSLNQGNIKFKSDKLNYKVSVESNVEFIDIYAFAKDINATVEINSPEHLDFGNNKITIKVTSTKGISKEYTIDVNRQKSSNDKNSNKLKDLIINGYNIHFDKDKSAYELIADNKNLIISAYPYDDSAKVTILENSQNKIERNIKILVTDENNITNTYTLNVKKQFWNRKNEILAVAGTFITGLGIVTIIQYYEMKNNNRKRKTVNK